MTVGNKLLVDTIGTTGYNFPVGAGPFPDGTFEAPVSLPAGPAPAFLAMADFDANGLADVAVTDVSDHAVRVFLTPGP